MSATMFAAAAAFVLLMSPADAMGTAFTVSLANVKLLQSKEAVIRTSVESAVMPSSCPVKPSKGDLSCYSGFSLVPTVPQATGWCVAPRQHGCLRVS
jgi:hypothetical protein